MENCVLSLSMAFDESSQDLYKDLSILLDKYPSVDFIAYHEGLLKERRKAFMLKGGYSAKLTPFAVLFDLDRNPIKAFYSEVGECTVKNIKQYIDQFISEQNQINNESTSN